MRLAPAAPSPSIAFIAEWTRPQGAGPAAGGHLRPATKQQTRSGKRAAQRGKARGADPKSLPGQPLADQELPGVGCQHRLGGGTDPVLRQGDLLRRRVRAAACWRAVRGAPHGAARQGVLSGRQQPG